MLNIVKKCHPLICACFCPEIREEDGQSYKDYTCARASASTSELSTQEFEIHIKIHIGGERKLINKLGSFWLDPKIFWL